MIRLRLNLKKQGGKFPLRQEIKTLRDDGELKALAAER